MDLVKKAIESDGFVQIVDGALGGIPVVGGLASNAFSSWVNKNRTVAREVILTNIRQGDIESMHTDEFFSMLSKFTRSVQEGLARNNLILLARLISGIGRVDGQDSKAETFNQYAGMLENLTYEEIKFLSEYIKHNGRALVFENTEELKQSLQQKGFFISEFKSSISNKEEIKNTDRVLNFDNTSVNYFPNSAVSGLQQYKTKKIPPYDVSIDIEYKFSQKMQKLLDTYGNIWEDIANE